MGVFDGLNGIFNTSNPGVVPPYIPAPKVLIGHVLEVCLDESSPMYKGSDLNIGTIRFRDAFGAPTKDLGKEKGTIASPADRSNYKLPLPGEQVVIYYAYSDQITPSNQNAPAYFYGPVIMNSANITNTSSPFVGIEPTLLNPLNSSGLTFTQVERRFDKQIKNIEVFKDATSKPVIHKQLRPYEGDYILQGRFGNTIRFGGTPSDRNAEDNASWATNRVGKPGDPIITIRLSNETLKASKAKSDLYDVEDINEDAASIYLTSTQQVPIKLAIPDKGTREHPLASWAYTYGISSPQTLPSETQMYDGESARGAGDKKSDKLVADPKDYGTQTNNTNQESANNEPNTNNTEAPGTSQQTGQNNDTE